MKIDEAMASDCPAAKVVAAHAGAGGKVEGRIVAQGVEVALHFRQKICGRSTHRKPREKPKNFNKCDEASREMPKRQEAITSD